MGFKYKLKNSKLYNFFKGIGHIIYNFFFCIKYPFLRMRNAWTGKKYGFRYTWYDNLMSGWKKAFGKQLLEDLKQALKKDHIKLSKYQIVEIKEKYGTLRIYDNGANENTFKVINKYELLSMCYCMYCGKPVRYVTRGWVNYLCEDCIKIEFYREQEDIDACRVTEDDIPKIYRYEDDNEINVDIKKEYGIDFYKLWDLK